MIRYNKRFAKDPRYMGWKSFLTTGNIINKDFAYYTVPQKLDVFDQEMFEKLRKADVINKKVIAGLYQIPESDVISIVYFPNAKAIKATIVRPLPSGALGERDVYGAQQHAPLVNFTFEL